jgi:Tfp pilus assembly protein PilE
MGQQQLLLIVLGVIIVGIAVVVGINVFTTSSSQANTDAVIADLTNIASDAQKFYKMPTNMGGGGNAFTGYTIPARLASSANGTYTASVAAQAVTLTGKGNQIGTNGQDSVKVTMVVGPSNITSTTINSR